MGCITIYLKKDNKLTVYFLNKTANRTKASSIIVAGDDVERSMVAQLFLGSLFWCKR
jgi:hypothetical protein